MLGMQTARQLSPRQKDAATAAGAAEPDVAAHPRHGPGVRAARMRLAHAHRFSDGELGDVGGMRRARRLGHADRTALIRSRISRTAARVASA